MVDRAGIVMMESRCCPGCGEEGDLGEIEFLHLFILGECHLPPTPDNPSEDHLQEHRQQAR